MEDIWWPQCCYLDNTRLTDNLNESRCPNPARWEIRGESEPMVHTCDEHLAILLEDMGSNIVTSLFSLVNEECNEI